MLSRRSLVIALAGVLTFAQAGCTVFDPKLAAARADPMATWVPAGLLSEHRLESPSGTGGIAGGHKGASLTRTLTFPDATSVISAQRGAIDAALSSGWSQDLGRDLLSRKLGSYRGQFRAAPSPLDETELLIIIDAI